MDGNFLKDKNPREQIDSSFKIRDKDNNYELNVRTNDVNLILKVSEKENQFIEYFEEELTITDIQNKHKIFKSYSLFKKFVDYIESQIENNKLKILKINDESHLLRLEQENIEFILKKKTFDKEIIKKNVYNERIKDKNEIEKLILDNKSKDQEILNLKVKLKELEKENEELKANNKQPKEENQKLKEENKNSNKNNNKFKIIEPGNLKKTGTNQTNEKPTNKPLSQRENNRRDNKNLEIIDEIPNQFKKNICNRPNKFHIVKGKNYYTNVEKNLVEYINYLNNRIKKIKSFLESNEKIIKNLSYKDIYSYHISNKGNSRNNNDHNLSENNKHNKSFIEKKPEYMNNNDNVNLSHKKYFNGIYKAKTKENIGNNLKRNYSNENKRNEINKNDLKQIKHKLSLTPFKCHHNNLDNKSNNTKGILINRYKSNYRINTENNQDKLNRIVNNICEKRNISSNKKENKSKNNQIIKVKNNIIKPINDKLKPKDNHKNYDNFLNRFKDFSYIYATLPCLTNIEPLIKYFLSNRKELKKNNNQLQLSNVFLEIIEILCEKKSLQEFTNNDYINMILNQENNFFNKPKKLLKYAFAHLHQELNKVKDIKPEFNQKFDGDLYKYIKNYEKYFNENYQSIISELFYIKYNSKIVCLECKEEFQENRLGNMFEFSLEEVEKYNNINGKDIKIITISDCFKLWQLFYNNNKCNKCEKEQVMSYNNTLFGKPKILIINIKINNKNENKLTIENVIDISNFFYNRENKYNYELINIMMDLGDNNFITFCKSFVDNNWYKYDNLKITKCSFEEIRSQGIPYLLFYSLIEN